jgi:2-iminobutanoate/2-iminopropanoate deaminase
MTSRSSASPDAPAAVGGYRQSIEVAGAGRWLFVSGQTGETANGHIPSEGYEQCRLAWVNVLHQLAAAGYTPAHLVKATAFVTSADLIPIHQQARNEVLGSQQPALSVVIVSQLADPHWRIEIEAVAAQ